MAWRARGFGMLLCCVFHAAAQPSGAAKCAGCHEEIAKSYALTGMAQAMSLPSSGNTFSGESPAYSHEASQSTFRMIARDGKYYQRREQVGFDGKITNVFEKEIHYVIGSGTLVRSYLHRTPDDRLIELPLSWYAEGGGQWRMSPGFDRAVHPGFRRAISAGCLFCHDAYPGSAPDRRGEDAVFPGALPLGIDCRRCHGEGAAHIRAAQQPGARVEEIRAKIVNPKRLHPDRQLEVCLQCHLETTSSRLPDSLVRFERGPFSYRPGEPLGDFKLAFDHAAGAGRGGKYEIVGAAYRLRQSACFLKSAGKLQCTTCHNPHRVQTASETGAACKQCHASKPHFAQADCVSCHMPKRRTEDVVHAVTTDHFIRRQPEAHDANAALAEAHETAETAYRSAVELYYPPALPATAANELMLAVAQVVQKSNLAGGLKRLAAAVAQYRPANAEYSLVLADAYRAAGQMEKALPLYAEAVRRDPTLVAGRVQWGAALRAAKQPARAVEVLQAAPSRAAAWYELGLAQLDVGRADAAAASLNQALARDADYAEAHNALGGIWMARGDLEKAEARVREAIRIWPEYADAHKNLGALLAARNDLPQAVWHLETALRLQPALTAARYHYSLALARLGRFDDARREVERVLREDPRHAEGHQVLAALLAGKGETAAAVAEYRRAIELRPGFGRALLGLAQVLAATGDRAGAVTVLESALRSTDAGARAAAEAMLRSLR